MTLTELDILMSRSKLQIKGISEPTDNEIAMQFIRDTRTGLLKNSDWRANSDLELSDAWKKYRKDLRDLPVNSNPKLDKNKNLTGVTWPTKPT